MMVRNYLNITLGTGSYLVDVDIILQIVNIGASDITRIPNKESFMVGGIMYLGSIIPLLELRDILAIEYNSVDFNDSVKEIGMYVMVVEVGGIRYGVIVDNFIDFLLIDGVDISGKNFLPIVYGEDIHTVLNLEKVILGL